MFWAEGTARTKAGLWKEPVRTGRREAGEAGADEQGGEQRR